MAIDKLIPQYLNSDTDQKLVKSVEMTDNLNVRISNDGEGTAGVIKNVKGTEVVGAKSASDAFPAGELRVVGAVANEKNREVLFLLWNNFKNHGIYRLDMTSGKYQKLYQDSVLNFAKYTHCDCDVVVNEENETLLYWTDNLNPPMKVNVNRLISSDYPSSLYSGTDDEKLLSLTVAKQPPLFAPAYNIVNNPSIDYNNISDKVFQFAYRYKYKDGEISSLSEFSTITASIPQLKDGIVEQSSLDFYNQINVFVRNSPADVEKITLYARQGNQGTFFEVEEIDNNGTSGTTLIEFRNDKLSSALSLDEVNKSYDNVPQVAKAQAIVGGRLMYGNYKEGYENVNTDVDASPVHREKGEFYHITENINPDNPGYSLPYRSVIADSTNDFDFGLDFSQLPATIPAGSTVFIDATIVVTELEVTKASTDYPAFSVAYRVQREQNGEIKDYVKAQNIYQNSYSLPIEAIKINKRFNFDLDTSRSAAISTIAQGLENEKYVSVIDADEGDIDQATEYDSKGRVWLAGAAFFKLEAVSLSNNLQVFYLHFGGADVHAKALTVPKPVSDSGILNVLTGSFELNVDIVKTPTISLGGMSGFNTNGGVLTGTADYTTAGFSGNSSYMAESIEGYKSFKENADHKFGIVYFDDRGRAGGVNKLDSVFVAPLSSREQRLNTNIDFRLKHNPPSWARKWQLVYGGNNKYDKFLQYSVTSALPSKDALQENIYVSMAALEGKPQSYKDNSGAKLEYKYQEGDKLRIIRYHDESSESYVYPTGYEFDVLGYEYISDESDSPFVLKPSYEKSRTGWFLVIRNRDLNRFSYDDVLAGDDFWDSKVFVEIYSRAKEAEEYVYYGMGKMYDVINGKHYGDRSVLSGTSASVTFYSPVTLATSPDRLYVGDVITAGGATITISDVYIETDGTYKYDYTGTVSPAAGTYSVIPNDYSEAVVTANQGDVYFRVRKIRKPNNFYDDYFLDEKFENNTYAYDIDYVEDVSVSDFFTSNATSKGKPYAHIPEAKTVHRRSSVTYSDAYVIDSDRLNLSSFNLSLANWTDLDILYGGINSMINRGDALTVVQESKASQIPVKRNLIEYSSGDAGISVSKNVLGLPSYYAGDFGTSHAESVIERFGVVYYVDAKAGKVLRLSADGITPISEKGMDSFFNDRFTSLLSSTDKIRVVGGFDPDNDEYLISVEPVYRADITIGSDIYDIPVDADAEFSIGGITYASSTVIWNTWGNLWNTYCGNWEDVGNGIILVDSAFNVQSIIVDSSFYGTTGTINILVTDSTYSFSAVATLNLDTGVVTMPSTTCEGDAITIGEATTVDEGFTIAYKHKDGVWGSKYSFNPTMYVNINNEMYSFYDTPSGVMWKHNVNDTRNNFYGTQYDSMFEVVSNRNPSMVKVFEAIGVEGDGTWSADMSTSFQNTTLGTTDFDLREGHKYAMIKRDTLKSKSHQIYIGKVESISNDTVTFTTPVNRLPFIVGDILKTASGSTLTGTGMEISGITDRKTIQCTTGISNISVGDDVFVEHSALIEGDPMRDVYMKIKMTSSDSVPFEVHAISLSYDRSRLHNDRVN